jgi:hypothetical protein
MGDDRTAGERFSILFFTTSWVHEEMIDRRAFLSVQMLNQI